LAGIFGWLPVKISGYFHKGDKFMIHKILKRVFIGMVVFFMVGFLTGNGFAGGSFSFKWGNDTNTEQQQVESKSKPKKGGPPAHAPAHGYRAKHQYRYYPSSNVYKDTERGIYFYLKGDNWEVGASLPLPLREGLGESVSLEMDTDKPYIHHAEHVKKYPPKKSKVKKKNKWAKKKK
jgi:hypothetical protein